MTIYFYGTLFSQNVQKQLSGVFLQNLQNSQKNTYARVLFTAKNFCEIFKSNFFWEHLRVTASGYV